MPDDPDVERLYTIALVAEAWGVLPSQAARDLDTDPERLSLTCIPILEYARAWRAMRRGKGAEALLPWKGTEILKHLERNTDLKAELARARTRK